MRIEIDLDRGGIQPIIELFNGVDYNQDFQITITHTPNRRVKVEKYPLLCSIINEIRSLGNRVEIELDCPHGCNQLNYASRMGFLEFMGIDFPYPLNRRAGGGRFIEIVNIAKSNYYSPNRDLLEVFSSNFNFTRKQVEELALIITELGNNCAMHSEGKGGAVLYCQKYPSQENLNLFITDSGIGIFEAMNNIDKYKRLNELEILRKSLEFGEGNGKGYGQGLFLVSEFIKRNNGKMLLVTGSTYCKIEDRNVLFNEFNSNYKGVALHLKIPYINNISIDDIMIEQMGGYG